MKIKTIWVQNYKGLRDTGEIELGERFTIVVGQNNAGKTALLERLALTRLENKPYRGSTDGPFHVLDEHSRTDVELELKGDELSWLVRSSSDHALVPVLPSSPPLTADQYNIYLNSDEFRSRTFSVPLVYRNGWHNPFERTGDSINTAVVRRTSNGQALFVGGFQHERQNAIAAYLAKRLGEFSYVFKAERFNVGSSGLQTHLMLEPNASNLAGVLNELQGKRPALFEQFNEVVTEVLPIVKWVGTVTSLSSTSSVTVQIWNENPKTVGTAVGQSLSDCGTGVGQVLAILLVVMTTPFGRMIVIDEPNSFLHPAATRALLQVLKRYPQHQYVIATHAAEVVSAVEPDRLVLARWQDSQTKVVVNKGGDIEAIKGALGDVGVRLSDVFGYDAVVWVEGPTEATCFPLVFASGSDTMRKRRLGYVAIINTGDLEAKRGDAELVWRIYERLSQQSSLMPRSVAFSLDREGRDDKQQAELVKRSRGLVHFLPRRAYENYLLHPLAISEIIPSAGGREAVANWIAKNGGSPEYGIKKHWDQNLNDLDWVTKVDAAKLLKNLFAALTSTKEEYRKPQHSIALTKWLLEHDPEHLKDLREYIARLHAAQDG